MQPPRIITPVPTSTASLASVIELSFSQLSVHNNAYFDNGRNLLNGTYNVDLRDSRSIQAAVFEAGKLKSGTLIENGISWTLVAIHTEMDQSPQFRLTEVLGVVGGMPREYTGQLNEGLQKHGNGEMKLPSGNQFSGVYTEGKSTKGTMKLPNGDLYHLDEVVNGKVKINSEVSVERRTAGKTIKVTGLAATQNLDHSLFKKGQIVKIVITYPDSNTIIEMSGPFTGSLDDPLYEAKKVSIKQDNTEVVSLADCTLKKGELVGNNRVTNMVKTPLNEDTLFRPGGLLAKVEWVKIRQITGWEGLNLMVVKEARSPEERKARFNQFQDPVYELNIPLINARNFVELEKELLRLNSADPNNSHVLTQLALMYQQTGGSTTITKSLLEQAAALDNPQALRMLAQMEVSGRTTLDERTRNLFLKSIILNDNFAASILIDYYLNHDIRKHVELATEQARKSNPEGWRALAYYFHHIKRDHVNAFRCIQLSFYIKVSTFSQYNDEARRGATTSAAIFSDQANDVQLMVVLYQDPMVKRLLSDELAEDFVKHAGTEEVRDPITYEEITNGAKVFKFCGIRANIHNIFLADSFHQCLNTGNNVNPTSRIPFIFAKVARWQDDMERIINSIGL